jgi:simple sugar transport system ATP-binding protein
MEPHAGTLVRNLSSSFKPFLEIAREIDRRFLRLLLLDEPTSVLGAADVRKLTQILKKSAAEGTAIIYVSHRLEEVTAISDRVTVLRDGRVVGRFERSQYDVQTLVKCMTGGTVTKVLKPSRQSCRRVLMKIENFHVDMAGERLCGTNLEIMEGEILGVAGLSGHGRPAFGPGIMGIVPTSGRFCLEGELLKDRNPAKTLAKRICCLPDDRTHSGLLQDHSVEENIIFTAVHARGRFLKSPWLAGLSLLDKGSARAFAEECVEHFQIKCRSVRQKVSELSGGNQQKVCLARALAVHPRMLLLAEPTRGVDIEARENLLRILLDLNHYSGMTLLIASSELDELRRLCDRIAVVCRGRVTDILGPQDDDRRFMEAFSGGSWGPK